MISYLNNIWICNYVYSILSGFKTNGRGNVYLLFNKIAGMFFSINLYSAVEQQLSRNLYSIYFYFSLFEMNGLNIVKLIMRLTTGGLSAEVCKNYKCEASMKHYEVWK